MALRLFSKINRIIYQNYGGAFYSKKAEPLTVQNVCEDNPATSSVNTENQACVSHGKFTGSFERPETEESKILHKNMQMHLQPAKLPHYYKPVVDVDAGIFPKTPDAEHQYRQFEKSITYKNVKLPLKKPRLANPFPDPVKAMPSDTISDQEKADQMQATARLPSNSSEPPSPCAAKAGFSQIRSYSTCKGGEKDKRKDQDKCKQGGKCKKIRSCEHPKEITCQRKYVFKTCKKQQAPYPSYSELCHTIPYEHPSECKQCPWKPSEHPTFKPTKKKK